MVGLVTLSLLGCTGDKPEDDTGDTSTTGPGWTIIGEDLDTAFLSIWGSASDDVWAVGADAGTGPAVVHYDGTSWTRVDVGSPGGLWWVTSTSDDTMWMAGEDGRVLKYSRAAGTAEETVLDPAITVFGVWGSSDSDVWAVGGDVTVAADAAQVWHFDGTAWALSTIPDEAARSFAVYKVWGRSATDVWACGTDGLIMHWDGTSWSTVPTGVDVTLFTVSGTDSAIYAVGGDGSATVIGNASGAFADESPEFAPQLNGIDATEAAPVAVGGQGAVFTRGDDGTWTADPRGQVTYYDLHGVWVDETGAIWTVGGKLSSFPLDHGIIAYGGDSSVPPL